MSENDDKSIIFVQQVISADTCSSNRYFLLLWLVLADRLVLMMPVPSTHVVQHAGTWDPGIGWKSSKCSIASGGLVPAHGTCGFVVCCLLPPYPSRPGKEWNERSLRPPQEKVESVESPGMTFHEIHWNTESLYWQLLVRDPRDPYYNRIMTFQVSNYWFIGILILAYYNFLYNWVPYIQQISTVLVTAQVDFYHQLCHDI